MVNHASSDVSLRQYPEPGKRNMVVRTFRKHKYLYFMIIPVIIWYIIFCYLPMYGVVTAFQNYSMNKGNWGSPFVGFKHFQELFADEFFWRAFANTVIIAIYRLATAFPIPIILAVLINEIRSRSYKTILQSMIYLPHFISWVIVASILITIFNPDSGLITAVYFLFGKEVPMILGSPSAFRHILIWSDIWKEAGWGTIIYTAAMASISPTLYEAAIVDGVGRWRQIWHITLPSIRNIIVIMLILIVGQILNWGFDQVYNLYNPIVYSTGDIIDTYIFRTALSDSKFSYAAAAGLFKSVICVILLLTANKIAAMMNEEGIY